MKLDYDEISPITNNHCVIVEADDTTNVTSYMCMESGYTTTDNMKIDSDTVKNYEKHITDLMVKTQFKDKERGLVWYLAFLNIPGVAMLYPSGDDSNSIKWHVAQVIELTPEERKQYPVPGKTDEYYTSRLDLENAKVFEKTEFESALDSFYEILNNIITHAKVDQD